MGQVHQDTPIVHSTTLLNHPFKRGQVHHNTPIGHLTYKSFEALMEQHSAIICCCALLLCCRMSFAHTWSLHVGLLVLKPSYVQAKTQQMSTTQGRSTGVPGNPDCTTHVRPRHRHSPCHRQRRRPSMNLLLMLLCFLQGLSHPRVSCPWTSASHPSNLGPSHSGSPNRRTR